MIEEVAGSQIADQGFVDLGRSSSNTSQTVLPGMSGCLFAFAYDRHRSDNQAFSSAKDLNLGRGMKKRLRSTPTWFSTCPFSQPEAGLQATGSAR